MFALSSDKNIRRYQRWRRRESLWWSRCRTCRKSSMMSRNNSVPIKIYPQTYNELSNDFSCKRFILSFALNFLLTTSLSISALGDVISVLQTCHKTKCKLCLRRGQILKDINQCEYELESALQLFNVSSFLISQRRCRTGFMTYISSRRRHFRLIRAYWVMP